jgi:hypothetical protein
LTWLLKRLEAYDRNALESGIFTDERLPKELAEGAEMDALQMQQVGKIMLQKLEKFLDHWEELTISPPQR